MPHSPSFRSAVLLAALLTGCTPAVNAPDPAPAASSLPAGQLEALVSDSGGQPAAGVKLRFTSPLESPIERVSDGTGAADLSGLKVGVDYLVQVSGQGFLPRAQVLQVPAAAAQGTALVLKIVLEKAGFSLDGRITLSNGQPAAAAVVNAGDTSVETDSDGRFSLMLATAPATIVASLQGDGSCTVQNGGCSLTPQNPLRRLRLDQHRPLGLDSVAFETQAAGPLADARSAGYEVLGWPGQSLDAARDTLWLSAPAQALTATEIQQIGDFVKAGGKLVVTSEWAGFGALDLASLRDLLAGFGLAPGSDTLHQDSRLTIANLAGPHPLLTGVTQLALYRSGSVQLLQADRAHLLAYTAADGFRIAAAGGQGVLGYAVAGRGKVVMVGDTSLWLADDADGNGTPNYREADNARLWKNTLNW